MAAGEGKPINKRITSVRLQYEGKAPASEILARPASDFVLATPNSGVNRLYFGDNLEVLTSLAKDSSIAGQVRLVYIDPPFATEAKFQSRKLSHAYEDSLAGAEFVEFLRERLIWIHHILADDGSLYLHLDERMSSYFRVVLDEIFGPANYRNCITRKKCNPKNYTRHSYGNVSDYILFYTKSANYVWNRPIEPWTPERADKEYEYAEPNGRRFKKVPVHAPGVRRGETGQPWRGKMPPPGKHWQFPPRVLDEMDARGEIYWSPTGNPRRKIYLDSSSGVPIQDIWLDVRDAHNQNIRITGYPTEKNPHLLRRIVMASSNPGDLVLDCFAGSGTTLAVAAELGRRWIGADTSPEAMKTMLRRFKHGLEPMGDFVSAQADPSNTSNAMLPGFETPAPAAKRERHRPVEDFGVYCDPAAVSAVRSLFTEMAAPIAMRDGETEDTDHEIEGEAESAVGNVGKT